MDLSEGKIIRDKDSRNLCVLCVERTTKDAKKFKGEIFTIDMEEEDLSMQISSEKY